MQVNVHFYSYFKDLTGCAEADFEVAEASTLGQLLEQVFHRFPKVSAMHNSMLTAVGVEYQGRSYQLQPGDAVALFPPVQGG